MARRAVRGLRTGAIQAAVLLAGLLLWEGVSRSHLIFPDLIPSVPQVLSRAWWHIASGAVLPHLAISLYEIAVGFALAAAGGVATGLLVGARPFLTALCEPPFLYMTSTPKIILFPLCLMLFGLDLNSKIALGVLSGFFPIALSTITGAREVSPVLLRTARSFGARPLQVYRKVYLPATARHIFSGLRLGMGVTIIGTVLGEIKLSRGGLGFLAINYYVQFAIADMYSIIFLIFLFAGGMNLLMSAILKRLDRYRSSVEG